MIFKGVGTFVIAPLANFWFEAYGWRGALRCLAGLCLACSLCGVAMFPGKQGLPTGNNSNHNSHNSTTSGTEGCLALLLGEQMASSPLLLAFLLVAIADCLAFTGVFIPYTYLPISSHHHHHYHPHHHHIIIILRCLHPLHVPAQRCQLRRSNSFRFLWSLPRILDRGECSPKICFS